MICRGVVGVTTLRGGAGGAPPPSAPDRARDAAIGDVVIPCGRTQSAGESSAAGGATTVTAEAEGTRAVEEELAAVAGATATTATMAT